MLAFIPKCTQNRKRRQVDSRFWIVIDKNGDGLLSHIVTGVIQLHKNCFLDDEGVFCRNSWNDNARPPTAATTKKNIYDFRREFFDNPSYGLNLTPSAYTSNSGFPIIHTQYIYNHFAF